MTIHDGWECGPGCNICIEERAAIVAQFRKSPLPSPTKLTIEFSCNFNPEETPVTTVNEIQVQIDRLQAELDALKLYPEKDPFPNGTVLRFEKQVYLGSAVYTYAVLKSAGRWYFTQDPERAPRRPMFWSALVEFFTGGDGHVPVDPKTILRSSTWTKAF